MTREDELNEAWCKYTGKCSTEVMQALAFALRWCDAHPNWISVEDELPELHKEVLVYTGKMVTIADLRYPTTLDWWDNDGRYMQNNKPTHWMPLPAVPKNNGKEGDER